jgi:hypothetical protein
MAFVTASFIKSNKNNKKQTKPQLPKNKNKFAYKNQREMTKKHWEMRDLYLHTRDYEVALDVEKYL